MNRKKQIDAMVKVVQSPLIGWGLGELTERGIANAFYNEGYRKASEVAREIIAIIEQRIGRNTELKAGIQSSIWQSHYEGCIQAYTDIKEIIEQKYTESEDTK